MENTKRKSGESNVSGIGPTSPRKRSGTTLKLQWVADRVRKCKRIKEALGHGTYHVDSQEVAKAILNIEAN